MKVTIEGFVYCKKYDWQDAATYTFYPYSVENDPTTIQVLEHTIEVDIPDDFDPTPAKIKILRAEKQRIQAEAHVKAENIEAQIQELLCIENKVPS